MTTPSAKPSFKLAFTDLRNLSTRELRDLAEGCCPMAKPAAALLAEREEKAAALERANRG